MPLNARNTRFFSRQRFAGFKAQKLLLYKRGDDMRQGVVFAAALFGCWHDEVTKTGQTLLGPLAVTVRTTWHLPCTELLRAGANYLNATDKLFDPLTGFWWIPYATESIDQRVFGNVIDVTCRQTSPS